MKAVIALFSILAVVSAHLGKPTRWDHLSELSVESYYSPIGYQLVEDDDQSGTGCNQKVCDGGAAESVQHAFFDDGSDVIICICPNAVLDADSIASQFSAVPYVVRQFAYYLTAASYGACNDHGTGPASLAHDHHIWFCQPVQHLGVFIHECGHTYNFNKDPNGHLTDRPEWQAAIDADTCVPDKYADKNAGEDFAQMVVVWAYIAKHSDDTSCLQNQLDLITSWIQ